MDIAVLSEVSLPVYYRGEKINKEGFRLDFLVEDKVIDELNPNGAKVEDTPDLRRRG